MSKSYLTITQAYTKLGLAGGGTSWIRKSELLATEKVDESLLTKYGNNDFVVDDDIQINPSINIHFVYNIFDSFIGYTTTLYLFTPESYDLIIDIWGISTTDFVNIKIKTLVDNVPSGATISSFYALNNPYPNTEKLSQIPTLLVSKWNSPIVIPSTIYEIMKEDLLITTLQNRNINFINDGSCIFKG